MRACVVVLALLLVSQGARADEARKAPNPALVPAPASPKKSRTVPWVLTGSGLGLVGTGITLIAIYKPEVENGDRDKYYRPTLIPGIAIAGGGAILTGVGLWLLSRRQNDHHRPDVRVDVGLGGGSVTITGVF
jgi:hypothetical protein